MKKVISLLFTLVLGLVFVGCGTVDNEEAHVTIEINPSIEMVVNNNEIVIAVYPLNEDGQMVLTDLELEGLTLEEAMNLYIAEAIELGFIDENALETDVVVEVVASQERVRSRIRTRLQERIENAFNENNIGAKVKDKVYTEAFVNEATEYGITPRHYGLIKLAMEINPELTIEEALLLTHAELVEIVKTQAVEWKAQMNQIRTQLRANMAAIYLEYAPEINALKLQIATAITNSEDTTALKAQLAALYDAMQAEIQAEIQNRGREFDHIGNFN